MKTTSVINSDLHFEHKQWKNELLFWKDELKSYPKRLDELAHRSTNENMLT